MARKTSGPTRRIIFSTLPENSLAQSSRVSRRTLMLLTETLPVLASELKYSLDKAGLPELALQVTALKIVDRCRCGDDFCSSFYTQPKPEGSYGPGLRTLPLECESGMLIIDVVDNVIMFVEVLYNEANRKQILAMLPD